MRVLLSNETLSALEEVSGEKISKNGDRVIRKVTEMAENGQNENEGIDISVCSQTEKMTEDDKQ